MRDKVLRYIRERNLLKPGDRVCAAVSGGADSVALLRALLELRSELGIVLFVSHFNHGLRAEAADADQAFVADLAREHSLELFIGHSDVRDHAILTKQTIEAAARELRYGWFAQLATLKRLDAIATGHTLDDQAETVLMKFLRGTGTRGLAGIYPQLPLSENGVPKSARVIRPLLAVIRSEVETYLKSLGQPWRDDETNINPAFTRNRLRHDLLPFLVREYNPNLRQILSETAEIARGEEQYWEDILDHELDLRAEPEGRSCLSLRDFHLPIALQRRIIKRFLETEGLAVDFEHVENALRCATGEIERANLSGGWIATRRDVYLELRSPHGTPRRQVCDYEFTLPVPGEIVVPATSLRVRAELVSEDAVGRETTDSLVSANLLSGDLVVRNWRPGDRYRPAYSGSEVKLKRLFSEKKVPEEQRSTWPVVLCGNEIVWVRGFPVAHQFRWTSGPAVRIAEIG